jgi:hypothetical protein
MTGKPNSALDQSRIRHLLWLAVPAMFGTQRGLVSLALGNRGEAGGSIL